MSKASSSSAKSRLSNLNKHLNPTPSLSQVEGLVKVSDEVSQALSQGRVVVAVESTIISHGMPYPQNLQTAKEVEDIIRKNGAVPATIAILDGIPCVGLSINELERLAKLGTKAQKTAKRDIAYVVSTRGNGATTVSATMFFSAMVGIPVFVTGGVGGVHRHGENTMDISSDLTELGKTPVSVISAGVKSILDIPRTLEYLETQGVCVAAYRTNEFPAFFSEESGCKVPCPVDSPEECARLIDANLELNLGTGILIAVPIPKENSASGSIIESARQRAVREARFLRYFAVRRVDFTSIRMQVIFMFIITLLSIFRAGEAGISSTFVRKTLPAIDMPLDSPVFAVPKGYNAPQQVHITQGDYDGRAVIISWITPDEPNSSHVQYGTSPGKYDLIADGRVSSYIFYEYKSGYIHHTLLYGLEYNTKYYYKLGSGNSSREFWFLTPPELGPDAPYKFGIIGDLGQTFNSLSTLEHYMQSGAQTVLYVGDLSYADKYFFNDIGLRWDTWGRFVERSAAYQPWMWSVGNHEIEYFPHLGENSPFTNYNQRYATPHSASKSGSPLWYAVRRASAHIIVLSSYSPFVTYMPQWTWLKEELERVEREKTPWLIILMHIPMYSSNEAHYMEGESMRVAFESWFVKYKVDVIFVGHVHAYERSYRISNIQDMSTGNCQPISHKSAPIYITVGDGGNQEGLAAMFKDPQPSFSAFREASYGHSTLEIINRTHALYHWNRNNDGENVPTNSFILRNQYWASSSKKKNGETTH